jgi:hypothetical protein
MWMEVLPPQQRAVKPHVVFATQATNVAVMLVWR